MIQHRALRPLSKALQIPLLRHLQCVRINITSKFTRTKICTWMNLPCFPTNLICCRILWIIWQTLRITAITIGPGILLNLANLTLWKAINAGAAEPEARNAAVPLLASGHKGTVAPAPLFVAEVAPDACSNGSIEAPQLRNLSHLQNLSTRTMIDALTVTNMDILLRTAKRPAKSLLMILSKN